MKGVYFFKRLWAVFSDFSAKSNRERADFILFFVSVFLEYILLFSVIYGKPSSGHALMRLFDVMLLGALFIAIFAHQFLIFRNFSLHASLSDGKFKNHEVAICLLFGVLTGEVGYLYIIAKCNFPEWPAVQQLLGVLDWLFEPLENRNNLVIWDLAALGSALKGVFALGAVLLSLTILVWDFRAQRQLGNDFLEKNSPPFGDQNLLSKSFSEAFIFFYLMDTFAILVWCALLGAVVPDGRLGMRSSEWIELLYKLSLVYSLLAFFRLYKGATLLNRLEDESMIHKTVI